MKKRKTKVPASQGRNLEALNPLMKKGHFHKVKEARFSEKDEIEAGIEEWESKNQG